MLVDLRDTDCERRAVRILVVKCPGHDVVQCPGHDVVQCPGHEPAGEFFDRTVDLYCSMHRSL